MLIICNGAFKSGSTWLHAIVEGILEIRGVALAEIPVRYGPKSSPVSRLKESTLADFVEAEDLDSKHYLTKAHFFSEILLRTSYPANVKFLFIERDLRDAIVSHYHHFTIYRKWRLSFEVYYYLVGRYKAYEIWLFNERCKKYFPSDLFFNYAEMKRDCRAAIHRLCSILELEPLTTEEEDRVIAVTSLDAMRKNAAEGDRRFYPETGSDNEKLFRKGKVGEYKEYFSERSLADIDEIMNGRFSSVGRSLYSLLFTLRRRISYS